jgi:hypothetical protein
MRRGWSVLLTGLVFAIIGCPSPEQPREAVTELPEATVPAPGTITPTPDVERIPLQELLASGVSGDVTLREIAARTSVQVTVRGGAPESMLQAHIHRGSCEQPGAAVVPLEPVIIDRDGLGTSVTTVDMPLGDLRRQPHSVLVHQPGEEPGLAVACAALPLEPE